NISLDNGLWSGRYWLPNEQYVEIRRQIPELDFVAGAVIKGRLRVYDYEFNVDLPRTLFYGSAVEAAPEAERKAFPFEETIYAGLDREGLVQPPQVATLRAQALELMRQRKLSGLPSLRPHVASASSVLRYNHAEGVFAGLGAIYTPQGQTRYDATFGYAFEAARPEVTVRARYQTESAKAVSLRGYYNEPRDQGIRPALPAILNSASTALLDRDYLHLYFTRGGEARWLTPTSRTGSLGFRAAYEEHSQPGPGNLTVAQLERVRATTEGTLGLLEATFEPGRWTLGPSWTVRTELSAGVRRFDPALSADSGLAEPSIYGRTRAALTAAFESPRRSTRVSVSAAGGTILGEPPFQDLFILGGVGTLPGNEYRNLIGKSYALVEAEVARALWAPWLQVRAHAAVGFVGQRDFPTSWPHGDQRSATSIGAGVGLLWDVLRFDVSRGRDFTRIYFTVRPDLWDML
ncbi:MAG TPA: hypothetical protein VK864_11375, partial [Longimicrobiales bacterium]|nr:hypothetical protein [Longimicrobiales bacterium]